MDWASRRNVFTIEANAEGLAAPAGLLEEPDRLAPTENGGSALMITPLNCALPSRSPASPVEHVPPIACILPWRRSRCVAPVVHMRGVGLEHGLAVLDRLADQATG
jgi:hypothetical protein